MSSTDEPLIDVGARRRAEPPWAVVYRAEAPRLMRLATALVGRDDGSEYTLYMAEPTTP